MAKTKVTKEQLAKFASIFKLAVSEDLGTYINREKLVRSHGLKFIGFEMDGYNNPRTMMEYLALLVFSNIAPNNARAKELINGTKKYNSNSDYRIFQATASATYSLFEDTNGNIVRKLQCSRGRYRSFDDLFIIMSHKFKTLTVEKLMTMLLELVPYGICGISYATYTMTLTACGGMRRIRSNAANSWCAPTSGPLAKTLTTHPFSNTEEFHTNLEKICLSSETKERAAAQNLSRFLNPVLSQYDSVFTWDSLLRLVEITNTTYNQKINLKYINITKLAIRYYKM